MNTSEALEGESFSIRVPRLPLAHATISSRVPESAHSHFNLMKVDISRPYHHLSSQEDVASSHLPPSKQCIPNWPTKPTQLDLGIGSRLYRASVDILLVLFPICFAVLGFLVLGLRDDSESSFGESILQATQVTPTIWPLVFSAIVGGMVKNLAHRRIQNGEKLMLIEQLMGSQTVFGTLKMVWKLHPTTVATPALILIWGLSPFGGQAILRSISKVAALDHSRVPISYFSLDPRITRNFDLVPGLGSSVDVASVPQTLFMSALLSTQSGLHGMNGSKQQDTFDQTVSSLGGIEAAIELSQRDIWNHVRIPIVDLLPDYDEAAFNRGEWFDVPKDRVLSYSAAIGIPVLRLPSKQIGNASFTIQSAYTRFRCDEKWMTYLDFERYLNRSNSSFQDPFPGSGLLISTDRAIAHKFTTTRPWNLTLYNSLVSKPCNVTERPVLFYTEVGYSKTSPYGITCYPRAVYVEVEITCSRTTQSGQLRCAAVRVRGSQDPKRPLCTSMTELDFVTPIYDALNYLLWVFYCATDTVGSSGAEQFLLNPAAVFKDDALVRNSVSGVPNDKVNMTEVAPSVFSSRLTMLWNTWSMATKDNGLVSGFEYANVGGNPRPADGKIALLANESSATWSYGVGNAYHVHGGWISVYMGSVLLLFACSLYAALIKYQLEIPEVLGTVSSLTRDSPYVRLPVPTAGSTLSGEDRAKLMKDVCIRMQNVKQGEKVGKLALSLCSDDERHKIPLDKNRLYE